MYKLLELPAGTPENMGKMSMRRKPRFFKLRLQLQMWIDRQKRRLLYVPTLGGLIAPHWRNRTGMHIFDYMQRSIEGSVGWGDYYDIFFSMAFESEAPARGLVLYVHEYMPDCRMVDILYNPYGFAWIVRGAVCGSRKEQNRCVVQ